MTQGQWKRIHEQATGALPVGTLTKWGIVLVSLLLAAFLVSQSLFNSAPEEEALVETGADQPAGPGTQAQVTARIRQEGLRQVAQREAAERALLRAQQLGLAPPGAAEGGAPGATSGAAIVPVPSGIVGADPIVPSSEAEAELREVLRLEEIERRRRSLRSAPVAQTYRGVNDTPTVAATDPDAPQAAPAQATQSYSPPPVMNQALQQSLDMLSAAVELETAAQAVTTPPDHEGETTPPSALGDAARALTGPTRDYANPPLVTAPSGPPGFERIYEGSFLEAVLVTQLSGDFPGPVLASVAVPFYSADRQRILIPRGARAIGTASRVDGLDQERLVVGFHRLLFPDGRWVALEFNGLNQLGEGALKDQVNRHYFSMFASVGAVGIISGLTMRGSDPYAGGAEGFRSGAGQGLGQGALQILQRFLNRLPNLTIRAGHRLRIWFTSDVLIPRPAGR